MSWTDIASFIIGIAMLAYAIHRYVKATNVAMRNVVILVVILNVWHILAFAFRKGYFHINLSFQIAFQLSGIVVLAGLLKAIKDAKDAF